MKTEIEYKGQIFICREVFEKETGFTHIVAPIELGRLLIDNDGNPFNNDAEYIDNEIFFYATDQEMKLTDVEILKLAFND